MSRFVKLAGQASGGAGSALPENACFTSVTSKGYKYCDTTQEKTLCVSQEVTIMSCPDWSPTTTSVLFSHDFFNYCCICLDMFVGSGQATSDHAPCIRFVFDNVLEDCQYVVRTLNSCNSGVTSCCCNAIGQNACYWQYSGSLHFQFFPTYINRTPTCGGATVGFTGYYGPQPEGQYMNERDRYRCGWLNNCFLCCRPQWATFNGICITYPRLNCNVCGVKQSFRITGFPKQTEDIE